VKGPPSLLPASVSPAAVPLPPTSHKRPPRNLPPLCNLQQAVQLAAPSQLSTAAVPPVTAPSLAGDGVIAGHPRFPETYRLRNEPIDVETHYYCTGCAQSYTTAAFDNHKSHARRTGGAERTPCTMSDTKHPLPRDLRIVDAISRRAFKEARIRVFVWVRTGSSELPGDEPLVASGSDTSEADLAAPLSVQRKRMELKAATYRAQRKEAKESRGCRPPSAQHDRRTDSSSDSDSDSDGKFHPIHPPNPPVGQSSARAPERTGNGQAPSTVSAQRCQRPAASHTDVPGKTPVLKAPDGDRHSTCADELFGFSLEHPDGGHKEDKLARPKHAGSGPVFRNNPVTASHIICRFCGITYSPQAYMNHKSEVRGLLASGSPLKHYSAGCVTPGPRLRIPTDNPDIAAAMASKNYALTRLLCHNYAISLGSVVMGAC
jgi:hypothetical protein